MIDFPKSFDVGTEPRVSFHPLQEWEGYVLAVGDQTFTARLTDLTAGASIAQEQAEFPLDDLADADRQMVAEGRIFRWAIGYQRQLGGSKRRISIIVFRRLPQWTRKELMKAEEEGTRLAAKLNWGQSTGEAKG
jgi:hypothetical protein